MQRLLTTTALTLSLLVLLAVPAFAHASFDVTQLPVGETADFSLRVPLEREAGNSEIAVLVPAGWTVGECPAADGWSCAARAEDDGDTVLSLTRTDDAAADTERFAVTLTAPAVEGVYAFPVVQTYDDGTEVAWIEEPGTDHPTPRIQVGDSETALERDDELPTHDAGVEDAPSPDVVADPDAPTQAPLPSDAPTSVAPTPADTATLSAEDSTPDEPDDGGSALPIVLGILALLAVIGAVVLANRPSDPTI